MEKNYQISTKIYKHLEQQKVQNNYVALLMKRFVFTKLFESEDVNFIFRQFN